MINVLFIGDIVGSSGHSMVCNFLPLLKRDFQIDFCIVNGENSDNGKGINAKQVQKLLDTGANAITSGNHIWQKSSIEVLKDARFKTIRPANYPKGNIGQGHLLLDTEQGKILIINLQGRSFLNPIDCPFQKAEEILNQFSVNKNLPVIVDFHAETTAEKQAMGWYLDGKISALVGTHTHVQTADERVLPNGTAYITDVGMSGPFNSVIGMDIDTAIDRFLKQTNFLYKPASQNIKINAVLIKINSNNKAEKIKRLNFSKEEDWKWLQKNLKNHFCRLFC